MITPSLLYGSPPRRRGGGGVSGEKRKKTSGHVREEVVFGSWAIPVAYYPERATAI